MKTLDFEFDSNFFVTKDDCCHRMEITFNVDSTKDGCGYFWGVKVLDLEIMKERELHEFSNEERYKILTKCQIYADEAAYE